jgi:hypothetical protein
MFFIIFCLATISNVDNARKGIPVNPQGSRACAETLEDSLGVLALASQGSQGTDYHGQVADGDED